MSRVRLGIIGAGAMGTFHARAAARIPSIDLVAVADIRPGAATRVAAEVGCEGTQELDVILHRREVAGVIVATPVETHLEMIEAAAAAGLGILCEKPLATTLEGCVNATAIARRQGVPLQVGFHRRFDPDWVAVHDAIDAGELGDLYMLKSTLRDMRPPSPDYIRNSGGYFLDAFIHDFDAARWLCGEVQSVTAVAATITDAFQDLDDFDNAAVTLRFASGALGLLDGSRTGGYGYDCTTEVLGARGAARIATPSTSNVTRLHDGVVATDLPTTYLERFGRAYAAEVEGFAETLRFGSIPRAGGRDALLALAIAVAAKASAERRETVDLREILGDIATEVGT